jgi:hypothetical protein
VGPCPVDTHVWKIAAALGWVPKSATRDTTYEHLNRRVPDECKFDLHVLLVEHGKAVQVDGIKPRVESAYGFSALNWNIINCFQRLLSVSTCAATTRQGVQERRGVAAVGGDATAGGRRAGTDAQRLPRVSRFRVQVLGFRFHVLGPKPYSLNPIVHHSHM